MIYVLRKKNCQRRKRGKCSMESDVVRKATLHWVIRAKMNQAILTALGIGIALDFAFDSCKQKMLKRTGQKINSKSRKTDGRLSNNLNLAVH